MAEGGPPFTWRARWLTATRRHCVAFSSNVHAPLRRLGEKHTWDPETGEGGIEGAVKKTYAELTATHVPGYVYVDDDIDQPSADGGVDNSLLAPGIAGGKLVFEKHYYLLYRPLPVPVEVRKVDAETDSPLVGATFSLYAARDRVTGATNVVWSVREQGLPDVASPEVAGLSFDRAVVPAQVVGPEDGDIEVVVRYTPRGAAGSTDSAGPGPVHRAQSADTRQLPATGDASQPSGVLLALLGAGAAAALLGTGLRMRRRS